MKACYSNAISQWLENIETWAIVWHRAKGTDTKRHCVKCLQEELAVLAMLQLGYANHKNLGYPAIHGEQPRRQHEYLMMDRADMLWAALSRWLETGSLTLNCDWLKFQQLMFFLDLLKIVCHKTKVQDKWWHASGMQRS